METRRERMVLLLVMAAVLVLMPFSSAHAASYKASPRVSAPKAAPKVYGSKGAPNPALPKLEGKAAVKAMNAGGGFVRLCDASKSLRIIPTVYVADGEDRRRMRRWNSRIGKNRDMGIIWTTDGGEVDERRVVSHGRAA